MNKSKCIFPIVLFLLGVLIGFLSHKILEDTNHYPLPDHITVTGVSFDLDQNKLTCNFVPEIYSEKLNYRVDVINLNFKSHKSYDANIENGSGTIEALVENSRNYKFVLIIDNGEETRNITLADDVYVNTQKNSITLK